jgi:hypothetical protein
MKMPLVVVLFAAAGLASAQKPTDAEAQDLIGKARAAALSYTASLPDFICTQMVHRYQDPRGDNRWQLLDVLTVKLSYSDHKEDYKLTEVNGKPTVLDFMNAGGPTSKGEFGSLLYFLFHPQMQAEFHWKGWATVRKHRAAIFTYKVDRAHTMYRVAYGPLVEDGPNSILAPYHGEVYVDAESGKVLRAAQTAELPIGFPISHSSTTVEYDYADVGGRQYLLPLRADVHLASGRMKARNSVEFKEYRKFAAEAVITFDK